MEIDFVKSGLTITFKNKFRDYGTFMDASRDPIYRTILAAFKELKEKDKVSINVTANVDSTEFESKLEFTKLNLDILTDVINPYFEEMEDYESCAKVMQVLSELQNN